MKNENQSEPVAWRFWSPDGTNVYQYNEDGDGEPLYTNPLRELSDEEIAALANKHRASGYGSVWPHEFARAVLEKARMG